MPTLSVFYGIIIRMYCAAVPHAHEEYADHQAVFSSADGKLLTGKSPKSQTRLALAWIEIRREELNANWKLAVSGEEVLRIDPFK